MGGLEFEVKVKNSGEVAADYKSDVLKVSLQWNKARLTLAESWIQKIYCLLFFDGRANPNMIFFTFTQQFEGFENVRLLYK